MTEVVNFVKPAKQAQTKTPLEDCFGDDACFLKICAEWRLARAQMQLNWANHHVATGWGHLSDAGIDLDSTPLDAMCNYENVLARIKPSTVMLARELLGVCVTILSHEDPKSVLAEGPVVEILRNVVKSLDWMNGTMPIGERSRSQQS
jgi:hypothetical protein